MSETMVPETMVRNNKLSTVGLLLTDGSTLPIPAGVSSQSTEKLGMINLKNAGCRAFMKGDHPVIQILKGDDGEDSVNLGEGDKPKTAVEMKKLIAASTDVEWLQQVHASDDRSSVVQAVNKRLDKLEVEAEAKAKAEADAAAGE